MRNNFGRPGFRRMRSVSESQSDARFRGGRHSGFASGRQPGESRVRRLSGSACGGLVEEAGMSRANSLGDTRGKNPPRERYPSTSKSTGSKSNAKTAKQQTKTKASVVKATGGASCSSQASAGASSQTKAVPAATTAAAGTSSHAS